MTEVTSLALAVDSRQVRTAASDLDRFSAAGKRSEIAARGAGSAFAGLRGLISGATVALAARQVIATADAYQTLNARLRLVTVGTGEFARAQAGVFDIAQRTRTGLGQTADLYGSLARSTESLGVTQREVLGVTETINQAIAVSGSNAASAAAALVQLGQGFSSGVLRGEELNSILEQAPRLARAIADGLGVPIGKLRELGQAGELTADRVFRALQKSATSIESEFSRVPLTVDGAMTKIGNSLSKVIGTIDDIGGASTGLAEFLGVAADAASQLASDLDALRAGESVINPISEAVFELTKWFRLSAAEAGVLFKVVGTALGALPVQIKALANFDLTTFRAISDAVREDIDRALGEFSAFQARLNVAVPRADVSSDAAEVAKFRRQQRVPTVTSSKARGGGRAADPFGDAIKGLREQIALVGKLTEAEQVAARISLGNYGKLGQAQKNRLLGLAAELDLRKEQEAERGAKLGIDLTGIQQDLNKLTRAYAASEDVLEALRSASLVDDRDYFNAKRGFIKLNADAEEAALRGQIDRLKAEKASGEDRIRNLAQITEKEARIQELRIEAAGQLRVLDIQQQSSLEALTRRYEEAEAAAQSYLDTLRKGFEIEVAGIGAGAAERDRLRGRSQIEDRYGEQRQRLESERRQGEISEETYRLELERIERFKSAALSSFDAYYAARIERERSFQTGIAEATANYISEASNVAKQAEDAFTRAFQGMEDALVTFVTTGKLDFKSLADSIIADITRIIIKQQIMAPLMQALGLGGDGGLGSSFFSSIFGGPRAAGGPVSANKLYRVNEKQPELLSVGGRDYLMMGAQGGMIDPKPGGQGTVVNVTLNQTFPPGTGRQTIDQAAARAAEAIQRAVSRQTASA